jgi:excisionase family DNA binding protein
MRRDTGREGKTVRITLTGDDGNEREVPRRLYELVEQALPMIAEGKAVAVIEVSHDLTTQQAAEILGCSRPHLIALVEGGKLACYMTGTHRRIRLSDLLEYKRRRDAKVSAALDEMVQISQEMGDY